MVLYLDAITQTDVDIGYINISTLVCIRQTRFTTPRNLQRPIGLARYNTVYYA